MRTKRKYLRSITLAAPIALKKWWKETSLFPSLSIKEI
jgi:hypothetical protein